MMDFTVQKLTDEDIEDGKPDSYQDLIEILPFFGDAEWFKKCVAFMGNARQKDDLAAQIKNEILEKIQRHREAKAKAPVRTYTK